MTTLLIAVCLLLLGVVCFAFIRFLWAYGRFLWEGGGFGSFQVGRWMHVSSVDEDGNPIGRGKWVRLKEPDRVDRGGLNHVVKYVARLVKSPSKRASLIISSWDNDSIGCLIVSEEGQLKILESVHTGSSVPTTKRRFSSLPPETPETEKEEAIRKLFEELGIAPEIDRVHEYNDYVDAMRDLVYPIGNDIAQATSIIQRLLRDVYHIQDSDGLDFTFEG